MDIQVVGVSHKTAPLALREQVSIGPADLERAYALARQWMPDQQGMVVVSTCNRTELYVAGPVPLVQVMAWWEAVAGVARERFQDRVYWKHDHDAAVHLFRVAAGLDSMVVGETQILGQLKQAYQAAQALEAVGGLHRLFNAAFRVGKRARSETGISQNAMSAGQAVVELARKVFGSLNGLTVLVVGAGEAGQMAARHFRQAGVDRLWVMSRTPAHAAALATAVGGTARPLGELGAAVAAADIVVSSTARPGLVLTKAAVARALRHAESGERFRFFFDLAVPRDVDPAIADLGQGIFVYDVDDLETVVESNRRRRQREAERVEQIVREEVSRLKEASDAQEMGTVIRLLREKAEAIRRQELERALRKLPELGEHERAVVDQAMRLTVNKLLNDAMVSLREWGGREDRALYVEALKELFRLQENAPVAEAAASPTPTGG